MEERRAPLLKEETLEKALSGAYVSGVSLCCLFDLGQIGISYLYSQTRSVDMGLSDTTYSGTLQVINCMKSLLS